jgi:hypothetical protein
MPPPTPTSIHVLPRYKDAYRMVAAILSFGGVIKCLSIAIGVLLLFSGLIATGIYGPGGMVGAVLLAVIVGLPIYIAGFLVSAQGQLLRAMLDTAVNTSPLISRSELEEIMQM